MITEQLTKRVKKESEYAPDCTRHIFSVDGVEVLHYCKTFYYDSKPYYSRVNSCGEYRPQISKEEFNQRLNDILNLK